MVAPDGRARTKADLEIYRVRLESKKLEEKQVVAVAGRAALDLVVQCQPFAVHRGDHLAAGCSTAGSRALLPYLDLKPVGKAA